MAIKITPLLYGYNKNISKDQFFLLGRTLFKLLRKLQALLVYLTAVHCGRRRRGVLQFGPAVDHSPAFPVPPARA